MKRKREVRQKTTTYSNSARKYKDIDLTPLFNTPRGPRADPAQESTVIQKNLNDKNSKLLFHRKAANNFGPEDCMLTLPYADNFLPATMEDGERELTNVLRRARDHMKKQGLGELKYMAVTECTLRKSGKHKGKLHIHHHVLISGALGRDYLENLWRRPPRKGQKEGDRLGYPSSKQLIFDENGIEGLMVYFFGEQKASAQEEAGIIREKGRRRWRGSKNLVDPAPPKKNDTRWSDSQVARLAKEIHETGHADPTYWEKQYPGYKFSKATPEYNEFTHRWSLYVRMHRRL